MEIGAIVLPVILMLVLGTFLKSKEMIGSECVSGIKNIIANIMLPVVLFNAISMAGFTGNDLKLVAGIYGVFTVILALGFLMRPFFGAYGRFAPFHCVSCETGMLGYPLYMTLYGQEGLSTIVRVDLANILFAFTVFLFAIKAAANGSLDKKRLALDPMGQSVMTFVVKVSLARLLLNGCGLTVIFFLFRSFWSDRGILAAVILMFCLPGQFITPIYVSEEEQRKYDGFERAEILYDH